MSILEKIRKARENLRNVETTATTEEGLVLKEKRSSDGGFTYVDGEDDDPRTGSGVGSAGREVQEIEITFKKESIPNGSQRAQSEVADRIGLSNRQLKARLRRKNLGFVLDLKPDLQMANVARGVYLGWVYLLSASLFTLLNEANAIEAIMPVQLGSTVELRFPRVKTIEFESGRGRYEVVKDDQLTHMAHELYGDRIRWYDHKLEIANLQKTDLGSFYYNQDQMPMVIRLQQEH